MDELKFPTIVIKFSTCSQTNEEIGAIYIKTLQDALNAARGDIQALQALNRVAKEMAWITDDLIYKAKIDLDNNHNKA